jgi:hypothetical protein
MTLSALMKISLAIAWQDLVYFANTLGVFQAQIEASGCFNETACLVTYFDLPDWDLFNTLA